MWILFAVLAAFCFGLRGILYHYTSQLPVSRTVLLCGTFFMGAVISLAAALLSGQQWQGTALVGLQMGLFSFVANASMFKGFAVGKASLIAILTALPPVIVVAAAYALWGEALNVLQWTAFAVIVAGILLVRYSNDLSLSNMQGAQWGLLALLMFACNDLSSSWSTKLSAPLFPTLFFMFAAGSACFGLWWLRDRRAAAARGEATISRAPGRQNAVQALRLREVGEEEAALAEIGSAGSEGKRRNRELLLAAAPDATGRGPGAAPLPSAGGRGERPGDPSAANSGAPSAPANRALGAAAAVAAAVLTPSATAAAGMAVRSPGEAAPAGAAELSSGGAAAARPGVRSPAETTADDAPRPLWSEGRTFLTGMLIGTTNAVGMMLLVTAFDFGKAGLVSAVVALNVLLVLLYTRFVVKERFSKLEIAGLATAFAGILFLRLFGG